MYSIVDHINRVALNGANSENLCKDIFEGMHKIERIFKDGYRDSEKLVPVEVRFVPEKALESNGTDVKPEALSEHPFEPVLDAFSKAMHKALEAFKRDPCGTCTLIFQIKDIKFLKQCGASEDPAECSNYWQYENYYDSCPPESMEGVYRANLTSFPPMPALPWLRRLVRDIGNSKKEGKYEAQLALEALIYGLLVIDDGADITLCLDPKRKPFIDTGCDDYDACMLKYYVNYNGKIYDMNCWIEVHSSGSQAEITFKQCDRYTKEQCKAVGCKCTNCAAARPDAAVRKAQKQEIWEDLPADQKMALQQEEDEEDEEDEDDESVSAAEEASPLRESSSPEF